LLLADLIRRGGSIVSDTIQKTINRPDELTELLAIYWKDGKRPISKQMKIGLGKAFEKFDEYQLAKWNREGDIKLRDVLFLVHAKPSKEREELYKRLANNELATPDTWESRLAGGENKKDVFEDLLKRKKLGYMALLRNLRGMIQAGVNSDLIRPALIEPAPSVLPYRFIAAAKHAPMFEPQLDQAMMKTMDSMDQLSGETVLLVDVSGSMDAALSAKSDLTRLDAACGLAILLSGVCPKLRMFTFSNNLVEVPPRKGMALRDAIVRSQQHGGTDLGGAVNTVMKQVKYERLIVISDEQSQTRVPDPTGKAYMINVASNKHGIGYGPWTHIDGFSEACVGFIQEYEKAAGISAD
jgi:60 kDa SS-A/Ro ribonucleoprotein